MYKETNFSEPVQRLTAAAVIHRAQDDSYLLVEELAQGRICINNPSGGFETRDTSLHHTATREAAEEARVVFFPEYCVGVFVTTYLSVKGFRVCSTRVAYGGRLERGEPQFPIDPGIVRAVWMPYQQILENIQQHRSSAVLRSINAHRTGVRLPLDFVNLQADS
jgi:ADP-ribose pyrophosphatase YjhB (NUDIX family)